MSEYLETINKAKALHEKGLTDEALALYIQLEKQHPEDSQLLHCIGMLLFQQQQLDQAIHYLKKAIQFIPNHALLHCHLGNVYKTHNQLEQARLSYETGLALDPNNPLLLNNLGTIYYLQGYMTNAESYFYQAIHAKPDYVDAHYHLALSQLKQRKAQAKQTLLDTIAIYPRHFGAHFQLACWLMQQQDYEAALPHLEQAETLQSQHLELQINLGHCHLHLKNYQAARKCYRLAGEMDPHDATIYYNLGILAQKEGYTDHAINYHQDALKLNPNYFEAHNNLGVLYLTKEHIPNALNHFKKALAIKPNDAAIRYKVDSLEQSKQLEAAPTEYIKQLFDQYAETYDQHLQEALDYQVPKLLLSLFLETKYNGHTLLDLGCGTGLCGTLFKPYFDNIAGVDISHNMLAFAQQKKVYDKLFEQDITEFLQKNTHQYHVILAGDVIVYMGKLELLFSLITEHLPKGGLFLFNIEAGNTTPYTTNQSGRFQHHPDYIHQLAHKYQLNVIAQQAATTRMQNNQPVAGWCFCIQRG